MKRTGVAAELPEKAHMLAAAFREAPPLPSAHSGGERERS